MTKRVVLFSVISALLLAGCGRSGPTEVARPVPLGTQKAPIQQPAAPSLEQTAPAYDQAYDSGAEYPEWAASGEDADVEASDEQAVEEEVPASTAEELAALEAAKQKAEEEAAKKKAEEEAKAAEAAAKKKAEEEAKAAEEAAKKVANKFVKSIGNGSLHSANGLTVLDGKLYVVDNQRTGLLGKYASVRGYDVASGDFLKLSFENVGWAGAKNLPTTVTRVKLESGKLIAADETHTYTYDLASASLVEKKEGTFALPTEVKDAKGYTYRINGNKVEKVLDGTVLVSFGDDVIGGCASIAIGADGTLFVSDKVKAVVHQFAPAEK